MNNRSGMHTDSQRLGENPSHYAHRKRNLAQLKEHIQNIT